MRERALRVEDELARLLADETGAPASDPIPRTVASVLGVLCRLGFGFVGGDGRRWNHAQVVAEIHDGFDLVARGWGATPCVRADSRRAECADILRDRAVGGNTCTRDDGVAMYVEPGTLPLS